MDEFFRSYWWLLFPIFFFVFGAWDRWLAYKRSRDHLDLLRSYAENGKEPPPELVRGAADHIDPNAPPPPPGGYPGYGPGYGPGSGYGGYGGYGGYWGSPRSMRRAYRHYYRWGPYWQWRSAFVTGAVAAGFWWAADWSDWPGVEGPFHLVAIIMTVVAVGNLIVAVLSTTFRGK